MSDRPIIFSAPMIRALLDGRKTQTRRTAFGVDIKRQVNGRWHVHNAHGGCFDVAENDVGRIAADYARFSPGDRLSVRENIIKTPAGVAYAADGGDHYGAGGRLKVTPSIHMPRWASRLTLIVESVKVERLNSISEADALAEGIVRSKASFEYDEGHGTFEKEQDWFSVPGMPDPGCGTSATDMFAMLWESINGPGSWDANPFVCAIGFRVIKANIDQIDAPTPTTR